jgi:uncharacterized protein
MAGMTRPPEVTDNSAQTRFELRIGNALAELVYRRRADRLVLVHTQVPEELAGRGIGGQLVQAALARAAAEDLTLVPLCPFARSWLQRHPDAAAGIRIDWDSR